MKIIDIKDHLDNIEIIVAFSKEAIKDFEKDILFKDYKKAKIFKFLNCKKACEVIGYDLKLPTNLKGKEINILLYVTKWLFFQPQLKPYVDEIFEYIPLTIENEFVSDFSFNLNFKFAKYPKLEIKDLSFLIHNENIKKVLNQTYDENDLDLILEFIKPYLKLVPQQTANNGYEIIVDLKLFKKENELKSFSDKNYKFILGKSKFSKKFDQQILNMKVNETKEFDIKFKDNFENFLLQNKTIKFKVTVKKINEIIKPKMIDEPFIKSLKIKGVSDFKSFNYFIKKHIEQKKQDDYLEAFDNEFISFTDDVIPVELTMGGELLRLEFFLVSAMDDIKHQEPLLQAMLTTSLVERFFVIHQCIKFYDIKMDEKEIENEIKIGDDFKNITYQDLTKDSLLFYTIKKNLLDLKFVNFMKDKILKSQNIVKEDKTKDIKKLN